MDNGYLHISTLQKLLDIWQAAEIKIVRERSYYTHKRALRDAI